MKYLFTVFGCLILIYGCSGNGQEPTIVQDIPTLPVDTLQVALEIGVEIGDSSNTFGAITSTMLDNKGRILVLDQVATCLKIFDSEGDFLLQVSRSGNGPGELVLPWDMFMMPDGRLVILDPGKLGFGPFDVNIFELSKKERSRIKPIPGNLSGALAALHKDHDFLLEGGVFDDTMIEDWISLKMEKDVIPRLWRK